MDLTKIWKKIEACRGMRRKIHDLERKIRSLSNVSHHTEEFIDLSSGETVIDLEAEMKREYAKRKIRGLRKEKMKLLAKRQDLVLELEKIYERLKREYAKDLVKMQLYFKKFVRELRKLETLWRCMTEDGNQVANTHRCLWELRCLLDKNEAIKTLPPYHRWKQDLERCFTILSNYEREVEGHGGNR